MQLYTVLAIDTCIQFSKQSRLLWLPAGRLLCFYCRCRAIHTGKVCEPGEMCFGLQPAFASYRELQLLSDGGGNLPEGNTFFRHSMINTLLRLLFNNKAIEHGGIVAMHCRPAVTAFADVRRYAIFFSHSHHHSNKAMIAFAMYRSRKPYDIGIDALCNYSPRGFFRSSTWYGSRAGRYILFRHRPRSMQQTYT